MVDVVTPVKRPNYAKACWHDSINRGEAALVPSAVLAELANVDEIGGALLGGLVWAERADVVAIYTDHGITEAMETSAKRALADGKVVEWRSTVPGRDASVPNGFAASA